jgi:hypothetical protein
MKVTDYTNYFKTDVKEAIESIDRVLIVAREDQLTEKIKQIKANEIFLVIIIPSSDSNAKNADDFMETHACLLYVLKCYNARDKVDTDFENAMEETQDVITLIKQKMIDDKSPAIHGDCPHIMHYFNPDAMHTDPEYNYLGCNGWSLSFNLLTPGL